MMIKNVFDSLVATMEHEKLAGLDLGKHSSEYYYANCVSEKNQECLACGTAGNLGTT